MTADMAGEKFAKLRNVFQLDMTGLGAAADAVNHLSNNMAAKAPQIIDYLARAGGAAQLLGMSAEQMAALGSTMVALGTMPETAARATTKLFTALATGSTKVDSAMKSLGLVRSEFVDLAKTDPGAAFEKLFAAVDKSENGLQALVDIVGQDFADDFLKIAGNTGLLAQAFQLVGNEADYAGSVLAEFEARAATTENAIQLFWNNLNAIKIETWSRTLPAINDGLNAMIGVMQTADERAMLFDRLEQGARGFINGLGLGESGALAGATAALDGLWESASRFLVGSLDEDAGGVLGRVFLAGQEAGENLRGLLDWLDQRTAGAQAAVGRNLEVALSIVGDIGSAIGSAFGEGSAGRAGLEWLAGFVLDAGAAGFELYHELVGKVLGGVRDISSWIATEAGALDWSALIPEGGLNLEPLNALGSAIGGFVDMVSGLLELGGTTLKAFFTGFLDGLIPYLEPMAERLGAIWDRLGGVFTNVGDGFTAIGSALGLLSENESAMRGVEQFGRVMGQLTGIVGNIALGGIEGIVALLEGVTRMVAALARGDIEAAFEPLAQFIGWLGSLTAGTILPDIDGAAVVAKIGEWFAFDWGDILPDWSIADILPDDGVVRDALDRLGSLFTGAEAPVAAAEINVAEPEPVAVSVAAVAAGQSEVAALQAEIARVTTQADAVPAAVQAAMNAARLAADLDLTAQGRKIMDTLAAGIRERAQAVIAEIQKVAQQVRDHLPSSPAKTGPLSDLHRLRFSETIAATIRGGPVVAAVERVAAQARAAANLNIPTAFGAGAGPNVIPIGPRLSSPPAGGRSGFGGGQSVTIHAPMTVTMTGSATAEDRAWFEEKLREHEDTIARLVADVSRRNARLEF